MALTKVTEVNLFTLASVASNTATYGSAVDVSTYYGASVRIRMGRGTGTAFTVAPIIRLQAAYASGAPDSQDWVTVAAFQLQLGSAAIGSQAVSGTEAAGQTVITLAAGTNFAAGDYVFFHNSTIGNSEWARVISISGADITIGEALVQAQTGATCRDQAEEFNLSLDLTSIQDVRIVADGSGSGQAFILEAALGAVSGL